MSMFTVLQAPQMADQFYAEGKIYVVVAVLSLVLIGLAIYLFKIDKKVSKLEDEIKDLS
jgi:hypothetical protein